MTAPMSIGPGTASNSGKRCRPHWGVSQLELLLLCYSIWSKHGNSDPPSSDAANRLRKWSPWPLESPPQCLPLYSQLVVTQLSTTENCCRSHKPARCGQRFTSIHQEFMWLPHQIPEPTSHTPFSLMSSSTCLNHLVPSHLMHLFPLNFNSNSLLSILVLPILVTWPNHCNLTLFCGLLRNISIIYIMQALTKDTMKSMSL